MRVAPCVCDGCVLALAQVWVPYDRLRHVAGGIDITIHSDSSLFGAPANDTKVDSGADPNAPPLFAIKALDGSRLRYTARLPLSAALSDALSTLPQGAQAWAEVDVVFTRVYGVFAATGEDCNVANLPFAYDSLVEGSITLLGRQYTFTQSPRFRAYVESTWGCGFPRPRDGADNAIEYPVSRGASRWLHGTAPSGCRTRVRHCRRTDPPHWRSGSGCGPCSHPHCPCHLP